MRLFNEARADSKRKANFGYGGIKTGDFGTGGRVYEREYRVESTTATEQNTCRKGISFCCAAIGLVSLIVIERWIYLTAGCVEEARANVVSLASPESSAAWDGSLVFTTTNPTYPPKYSGPLLEDPLFTSVKMPARSGSFKRQTEYCQWRETRHKKQVHIGNEPDFCASTKRSDDCANAHCSSRSVGSCSGPCCQVRRGAKKYKEEVWFTYHKAWRKARINSLLFDNPAAYHNPTRDPAPTKTFFVGGEGIDLSGGSGNGGLHLSGKDLAPAMMPASPVPLYKAAVSDLPEEALSLGFHEADHRYFYSRVPKDGINNPIIRSAASYLIDGVLDVNEISKATGIESLLSGAGLGWITKGTCNAGDIRVSFFSRRIPDAVSLIGKQISSGSGLSRIIPHTYSNGETKLFVRSGVMDAEAILQITLSDETFWTNVYRIAVTLVLMLASFIGTSDGFVNSVAVAGAGGSLALTMIWSYFYGTTAAVIPAIATIIFGGYISIVMKNGSKESGLKHD